MFAVRCPALLLQILRCAQKDSEKLFRMTFLVTIDGGASCHQDAAAGGVKDLEHHFGFLLRLSSQILHSLLLLTQCFPGDQKIF